MKCYDSNTVHIFSHYGVEPLGTCKRWSSKEKKHIDVERPLVVYSIHLRGVDLADMFLELYLSDLPSRKWYMGIVFYSLDVAVVNGRLLYLTAYGAKESGQETILPLRNFRSSIAHALVKKAKQSRKRGRPS